MFYCSIFKNHPDSSEKKIIYVLLSFIPITNISIKLHTFPTKRLMVVGMLGNKRARKIGLVYWFSLIDETNHKFGVGNNWIF